MARYAAKGGPGSAARSNGAGASSAAIASSSTILEFVKRSSEKFIPGSQATLAVEATVHFHVIKTPIQAHIMTVVASHPIALR